MKFYSLADANTVLIMLRFKRVKPGFMTHCMQLNWVGLGSRRYIKESLSQSYLLYDSGGCKQKVS